MVTVDSDETTVLENIDSNIERVKFAKIPRDENGKPIGTPWEEVLEEMYDDLSEHYGVDLRTL
jgi:hypothetical protein